jgi:hypothetical protein
MAQADQPFRLNPNQILDYYIRAPNGSLVPVVDNREDHIQDDAPNRWRISSSSMRRQSMRRSAWD